MSYFQAQGTTIVARRGYSSTGGVWDTIKSFGSKTLDYAKGAEQAKGAAAAQQQLLAQQQAQQSSGPPSWLLPVAVVGVVGAVVIMRRRK